MKWKMLHLFVKRNPNPSLQFKKNNNQPVK